MMDEETSKLANRLFDEAKSNLETPLTGYIFTPICQSCRNGDMRYGTWDEPECAVYGQIPKQYIQAKTKSCPKYEFDPKKKHHKPFTEEDIER